MIYEINNKYYIKVGKDFVEVEMVIKNDDIQLKPTKNKVENNGNVKYKEINLMGNKDKFIEENRRRNSRHEEESEEKPGRFSR